MSSAIRARSKSMSLVGFESRSSARCRAASARAASISCRRLRDLRQDRDAIGLHFDEPECDRQIVLFSWSLAVPQLAHLQRGEQRRMAGQHAEIALGSGNLHLVHLLVDQQAIGRDDLQLRCEGIGGIAIVR